MEVIASRTRHDYNLASTKAQQTEQQFVKWVSFVGSLKHSLFSTAKNKLFPSYTITVDKNPVRGHFTTIQQAYASLGTWLRICIVSN
ncbi:unnamed protein product [Lactuca virosa]|uniref:Uncharacterized protein n=1 Tax=Lactuca virosa TaxID=75947 RepID=A0AAU9LXV0_9ASTR|nr:unnamed protein product [Lactuca virosa]